MAMIEIHRLTKRFLTTDATCVPLNGICLTVGGGDFIALQGASASGKTTLLNLLAGIEQPTSGCIIVNGKEITRLSRSQLADWRGANVGYILQSHNLIAVLTVYENVELPLRLLPLSASQRHARVQRTLQTVHLIGCAGCYPRHLSCGEEERAAIARATVANPPILLGDEPTGSLDPGGSQEVVDLLEELNVQLGMTLIVATSDSRLAAVARRKFRLVGGQLAELHDDGSVLHEPW